MISGLSGTGHFANQRRVVNMTALLEDHEMASEIETYLDAFEEVQRLLKRLSGMADQINAVAEAIADDPREAAAMIPPDWPTRDQLRGLLGEIGTSQDQLALKWKSVPERIRNAMPNKRPDMVGEDWEEDSD